VSSHSQRKTILPPDVFDKYANLVFWHDLKNCRAFRIVAQKEE
jgi:sulfotransferase